jgi:hypothetical protein
VLFYYVSLRTKFRVVLSASISAKNRFVFFCRRDPVLFMLFVFVANSDVQHVSAIKKDNP